MAAVLQLAADLSKVRLPSSPSLFFLLKTSFKYPKISINSSSHIPIRCLSASASPQHQSDPRLFHQPHHNPNPNSDPSNWSTAQNPSSNQQWSSQNSSPNQQWNSQNRNPNPNQWSHQNPNSGQQWRPQNHAPNQQWTPPNPDPNQWRPPRNPIPNQQWSPPDHNPIHNQQWGAQNQRPPPIDHRPPVPGSASAPGMSQPHHTRRPWTSRPSVERARLRRR